MIFTYPAQQVQVDTTLLAKESKQDDLIALVENLGGSLAPNEYDEVDLTYVTVGNGIGEIETVVYKLSTVTQATLTLSYDANDNLINVIRS